MAEFSVLLSVYKKENPVYLNECFESIFINQTVKPTEVILVSDGLLTNELNLIIEKWTSLYPATLKIIFLQNNMGLGYALNLGIKHCSSEWVFRMDTDDICILDRFEKQINFIKKNPDIVLLGTTTEEFDESMSISQGFRKLPNTNHDIKIFSRKRNPFNHMTVAFKKNTIIAVGGYKHHLYMEDYNLWIRVIAAGHKVANLEESLVKVRGGKSMIQRRKGLNYIKSEYLLAKFKIQLNIDNPISATRYFLLRSIPRLFPTSTLTTIYKKLRK